MLVLFYIRVKFSKQKHLNWRDKEVPEIFQDYKMKLVIFLIKWRPNINSPSEKGHTHSKARTEINWRWVNKAELEHIFWGRRKMNEKKAQILKG